MRNAPRILAIKDVADKRSLGTFRRNGAVCLLFFSHSVSVLTGSVNRLWTLAQSADDVLYFGVRPSILEFGSKECVRAY